MFRKHLGSISSVTSPKSSLEYDWLAFGRFLLLCYSFVIVFLASIIEKNQSICLCTIPRGNNKRIKYSQFSIVSHSHKYGVEHMLK